MNYETERIAELRAMAALPRTSNYTFESELEEELEFARECVRRTRLELLKVKRREARHARDIAKFDRRFGPGAWERFDAERGYGDLTAKWIERDRARLTERVERECAFRDEIREAIRYIRKERRARLKEVSKLRDALERRSA